jgi:hypothetical protein
MRQANLNFLKERYKVIESQEKQKAEESNKQKETHIKTIEQLEIEKEDQRTKNIIDRYVEWAFENNSCEERLREEIKFHAKEYVTNKEARRVSSGDFSKYLILVGLIIKDGIITKSKLNESLNNKAI